MKNKKIIIGLVVVVFVLILLIIFFNINKSTKKNLENDNSKENEVLETSNNKDNSNSKNLVVYFSMAGEVYNVGTVDTGNTAIMASYIVDYLNCDSFEIIPEKDYPTKYNDLIEIAKKEQSSDARPKIKNKIENIDNYDTIFIGYPIWWGDLPQILYTFLESYDFANKNIYLFNTHEGSGSAGTYNKVKEKLKNSKVNLNGLALQGKVARSESGKNKTIDFLKQLGY